MEKMLTNWSFIDANERSLQNPDSFQVPSLMDLALIRPGWHVKVGIELNQGVLDEETKLNGERFWVRVVSIEENQINGFVDNDLVIDAHGLQYGDPITLGMNNVIDIFPPQGTSD